MNITEENKNVEVPKETLVGLYRIMCGLSSNFSNAEVYDDARDGMTKAHNWVIEYGKNNNINSRGGE